MHIKFMHVQYNKINVSLCLAGLGDHRLGTHQAGPLSGLANEQGPAWRLPQEEKAAIDRGHSVTESFTKCMC